MSGPKKSPVKKPPQPKLAKQDQELIDAASDAIRKRYRYDWQEVGAALRLAAEIAAAACGWP